MLIVFFGLSFKEIDEFLICLIEIIFEREFRVRFMFFLIKRYVRVEWGFGFLCLDYYSVVFWEDLDKIRFKEWTGAGDEGGEKGWEVGGKGGRGRCE